MEQVQAVFFKKKKRKKKTVLSYFGFHQINSHLALLSFNYLSFQISLIFSELSQMNSSYPTIKKFKFNKFNPNIKKCYFLKRIK